MGSSGINLSCLPMIKFTPLTNHRRIIGVYDRLFLLYFAILLRTATCCRAHSEPFGNKHNNNRNVYSASSQHNDHFLTPITTFAFRSVLPKTTTSIKTRSYRSPENSHTVHNNPSHRSFGHTHTSTRLYNVRPTRDNLIGGISQITFGFCLGVLFSEYAIITTGCGPSNFSDTLERISYQGVIVSSGLALFNRIVYRTELATTCDEMFGGIEPLRVDTLWQVRVVEWTSALAVGGAFVALAVQDERGAVMDGLSGIDVDMCRAIRELWCLVYVVLEGGGDASIPAELSVYVLIYVYIRWRDRDGWQKLWVQDTELWGKDMQCLSDLDLCSLSIILYQLLYNTRQHRKLSNLNKLTRSRKKISMPWITR